MRTVAPAIAALGPLHGVRRRRLAVSGPLGVTVGLSAAPWGPSKPAGVLQGTPENPKKCPSTPFLSTAGFARSAAPASARNWCCYWRSGDTAVQMSILAHLMVGRRLRYKDLRIGKGNRYAVATQTKAAGARINRNPVGPRCARP